MACFPPFLVRQDVRRERWFVYAPAWEPPYPTKENTLPSQPYCPEGRPYFLLVFMQIGLLWMVSTFLYERIGKVAFETSKYPEYYRP
jgi:hypothetical protein